VVAVSARLNSIVMLLRLKFAVMNFSDYRKFVGLLLLITAAISVGCNSTASSSSEVPKVETQSKPTQPETTATPFAEPVTSLDANKFTDGLRETWRRFTASGQYRLAQTSDMRFPDRAKEAALRSLPENPIPFVYIWGDLNFKKRVEDDHLAAIVVDTTKQDNNRFSLVIFSPPEGKKDVFETHWFYRDRDLSKTTVNRASGYFYVTEYFDDGTQKSCSVAWNLKQKVFECEKLK